MRATTTWRTIAVSPHRELSAGWERIPTSTIAPATEPRVTSRSFSSSSAPSALATRAMLARSSRPIRTPAAGAQVRGSRPLSALPSPIRPAVATKAITAPARATASAAVSARVESGGGGREVTRPAMVRSAARPPPARASPTRSSQVATVPGQSRGWSSPPVAGGASGTTRAAPLPAGGAGPTEKAIVPSVRWPSSADTTVQIAA